MQKKIRRMFAGCLALVLGLTTGFSVSATEQLETEPVKTYLLQVEESEHGTILVDGEAVREQMVEPGQQIVLTATPEEGYETISMSAETADGMEIQLDQTGNVYLYTMVEEDVIIRAQFLPLAQTESGSGEEEVLQTEIEEKETWTTEAGGSIQPKESQTGNSEEAEAGTNREQIQAAVRKVGEAGIFLQDASTVYVEHFGTIPYPENIGSYNDYDYQIEGNRAYCLEPMKHGPQTGNYSSAYVYTSSNTQLIKVFYYGYGGPGDITAKYGDDNVRHILTHVACGMAYGAENPTYSMTEQGISLANQFYTECMAQPDPPAGSCTLYILDIDEGSQDLGYVVYDLTRDGSLEIRKSSAFPSITDGNDCYSMEGAVFQLYAAGTSNVAATLTTDASGYARADGIPEGSYEIQEIQAPPGYLLDNTRYPITITRDTVYTYNCADQPGNDPVTFLVLKRDSETGQAQPQVRLEGAEYAVKYYDVESATDPAENGQEPMYTWILRTDETGAAILDNTHKVDGDEFVINPESGLAVLPVGTLTIQETKAPEGYVLNDTIYVANTVVQSGTSVVTTNLPNTEEHPAIEQIIRGDLAFTKINADDASPMAGIPFSITSQTTGESHVIVTDETGYVSTAADHAPHTQNTNRGETSGDGVWFGGGDPDNTKGALPYDTYTIEEKPCEANVGKDLLMFEVTLERNGQMLELGQLSNFTIVIQTEARDEKTGTKTVAAEEDASIIDIFRYENLTPGRTYVLKSWLVDAEGIILSEPVEKTLVPEEESGRMEITLQLDTSDMAGKTIVVFSELYWENICVASHKDLSDEAETVRVPKVGTTALDGDTGTHVGTVGEMVEIVDTVSYTGLTPGKEYTVSGTLYVRETEATLEISGEPVTAEKIFIPEEPDGTIELVFCFDSTPLAGQTVVAFETLTYEGVQVATHADIQDSGQSINYPSIHTQAQGEETKIQQAATGKDTEIVDTVSLSNLIPGEEYALQGEIIDRETGERIQMDVAELFFTAEAEEESKEMLFIMDTSSLQGKTLVIYEYLIHQDITVTSHTERFDTAQMIYIPSVETTALDGDTVSHVGTVKKEAVITDIVNYTNLIPGKSYRVQGTLMVRETGEALLMDGQPVTAEQSFIPEAPSGSVILSYTVDSTLLSGKTVVVFEDLLFEGITLVSHADLEDESQSVHYPEIGTEATAGGSHAVTAGEVKEIRDLVKLTTLIPGETYTLRGKVMGQTNGTVLTVHGQAVTASKTFTADAAQMEVEIFFTLDTSGLSGETVIVFEQLYHNNVQIVAHEDLEDETQAVFFEAPPLPPADTPHTGDTSINRAVTVTALVLAGAVAGFLICEKKRRRQ